MKQHLTDSVTSTFSQKQSQAKKVAVLGAGIIGLNSAFWLQRAGYQVTLIDVEKPGLGASFGNAGLFADYGRLPFATFAMLRKLPAMLIDKQSPLAIDFKYTPNLLNYGQEYVKACFDRRYQAGKQGLLALHRLVKETDQAVISATNSKHLISHQGFLGLYSTRESFENAKSNFDERAEQGVEFRLLNSEQIKSLEPNLKLPCQGAVYYPNTYHSLNPNQYCQSIFEHFCRQGGGFIQEKISRLTAKNGQLGLHSVVNSYEFDHLVITTGAASKPLVEQLGLSIPQVCERGYHLMLENTQDSLNRPIAWMNQGVHMTPMNSGIRVAGSAEYTHIDSQPSEQRKRVMLKHAQTMMGNDLNVASSWVGSRPTTPDSLPVIANMKSHPNVTLAFGHGHLGLTLASVTGKAVEQLVTGSTTDLDLSAFSAERFN